MNDNSPSSCRLAARTETLTEAAMLLQIVRMIFNKEVKDWECAIFDFLDRTIWHTSPCGQMRGYRLEEVEWPELDLDGLCPEGFRHFAIFIAIMLVEYVKENPSPEKRSLVGISRYYGLSYEWIAQKVCRLHRGQLFSMRYSTVKLVAQKMGCPLMAVIAAMDQDWKAYDDLVRMRREDYGYTPGRDDIDAYLVAMQTYTRSVADLPERLSAYRRLANGWDDLNSLVKVFYTKRIRDIAIEDMCIYTILVAVHEYEETAVMFFKKVEAYATTGKLLDEEET